MPDDSNSIGRIIRRAQREAARAVERQAAQAAGMRFSGFRRPMPDEVR